MKSPLPRDAVLVGVDCGASDVRAHAIDVVRDERGEGWRVGSHSARASHEPANGFVPLDVDRQRTELADPRLSRPEQDAAASWIEATARCVLEVARSSGARRACVGIAMPGRKTPDGRGIALARNGPRIPRFAEGFEEALARGGLTLLAPIPRLASDGECRGLGERLGDEGLFRGVDTAYYAGGGTGVAEALMLRGEHVALESIEAWFPRAWQLDDASGASYDERLSAAGVNRSYASAIGRALPLRRGEYPEDRANEDPAAARVLADAGRSLGELLELRLRAVWEREPHANGDRAALQRIVLGQRLGLWFADSRTPFAEQCTRALATALASSSDGGFRARYLDPTTSVPRVRPGLLAVSHFEAAAALGVAALALRELAEVLA